MVWWVCSVLTVIERCHTHIKYPMSTISHNFPDVVRFGSFVRSSCVNAMEYRRRVKVDPGQHRNSCSVISRDGCHWRQHRLGQKFVRHSMDEFPISQQQQQMREYFSIISWQLYAEINKSGEVLRANHRTKFIVNRLSYNIH